MILDTGAVFAALDTDDKNHERCAHLFKGVTPQNLLLPSPVFTEVCWLLESRIGPAAEEAFIRMVAQGSLTLVALLDQDLAIMADTVAKYADFPLGSVDASVAAVADRLRIPEIATLDQRHFRAIRSREFGSFTLLP